MAFDKIIVLDDEMIIRKSMEQQLRKKRYTVACASTLKEAQDLIGKDRFDLIFADVQLPDGTGLELLEMFQRMPESPTAIMITGYGSIDNAVECMRMGAFGYITKPFDQKQIDIEIKRAEDFARAVKVNRYYSEQLKDSGNMLGDSEAMQKLRKVIRRVAATEVGVFIRGENGTGKELVAQELYRLSPRGNEPFIRVNCAAINESLMESEFFGHEKGAFTGATERHEGRFELAHKGTILLDEISEIPTKLQSKLLRALQEQEFERVGGNRTISVDVRVLSSTNRKLEEAIEKGEFREDLFYRLNVFPVVVPPLRERPEDIPTLADNFLKNASRKNGIPVKGFSKQAMKSLQAHHWPGNVRELQNCVERAIILAEEQKPIDAELLGLPTEAVQTVPRSSPDESTATPSASSPTQTDSEETPAPTEKTETAAHSSENNASVKPLDEVERDHILIVLGEMKGNKTAAAEKLNVSIRTLRNKLNQYRKQGITIP